MNDESLVTLLAPRARDGCRDSRLALKHLMADVSQRPPLTAFCSAIIVVNVNQLLKRLSESRYCCQPPPRD
jgi:hypothetical protein